MVRLLGALICTAFLLFNAAAAPMPMEGKKTLFQRVLARPGATMRASASETAAEVQPVRPFDVFYVFKKEGEADGWTAVGRDRDGAEEGWIKSKELVEWKQTIVAAFTNPAGRERALLFRSDEALSQVYNSESRQTEISQLREAAAAGTVAANAPVLSIEPENFIDIDKKFYILPILSHQRIKMPKGPSAKLLEVASISKRDKKSSNSREELLKNYRIGIVFAIDTTKSMTPYITMTRQAIADLQKKIGNGPEGKRIRFGLVGFRDNTDLVPELGYVSKTFLKLGEDSTGDRFVAAIDGMEAAEASSVGFNEDAVSGVKAALDENDWEPFGGRFIVVISDAGPREPGAMAKHGGLAVRELNIEAREKKKAAIYAIHLKTPAGQSDHNYAKQAYSDLSAFPGSPSLYYGVEGGEVSEFGRIVSELANALTDQISAAVDGELSRRESAGGSSVRESAGIVGRAMQLAYLGRTEGTEAPELFNAFVTDRDPIDAKARPISARIMLSRNEVSTLRDMIGSVIRLGNANVQSGDSQQFFRQLREAVALAARDPDHIQDVNSLDDALGEYLEGLPYESDVLGLDEAAWQNMPAARERELIDSLESKMAALESIHNDPARWYALYDGAPEGEHVTTIPLDLLP